MFGEFQRLMNQDRILPVIGVLIVGFGLFFLISSLSYSELDSPNSSRPVELVENWGGRIGANLSYFSFFCEDILLQCYVNVLNTLKVF